jgi:hypothetical protein
LARVSGEDLGGRPAPRSRSGNGAEVSVTEWQGRPEGGIHHGAPARAAARRHPPGAGWRPRYRTV